MHLSATEEVIPWNTIGHAYDMWCGHASEIMVERCVILVPKKGGFSGLGKILECFQGRDVNLVHIESRLRVPAAGSPPETDSRGLEYLFIVTCDKTLFEVTVEDLKEQCSSVSVIESPSLPWFPRNLVEVAKCAKALYKYGNNLAADHPGYGDGDYERRRQFIAEIAMNHTLGKPIPRVEHTEKEKETWRVIFEHQCRFYPTHACKEYNSGLALLQKHFLYKEDDLPQLEDISNFLKTQTGFQLIPVVGWIHSRDFLALLAFRVFPCTQYIRHHSKPYYTPEPDICHELLGHVPMFCDQKFADFSQQIGLASLGASDVWIKKLSTLYWFTIEFGMVEENGEQRAYGAGLLSSCEELEFCVTDAAKRQPFDCTQAVEATYNEVGLQSFYFVTKSLDDMKQKMVEFSNTIPKSFSVSYDEQQQRISVDFKKQCSST